MGPEDLPRLKHWSDQALRGFIDSMDNEERAIAARAILDYRQYILPRIAERREQPQDDLLSALIHARIKDATEVDGELVGPRQLTDGEIMPIILQVLVGANETTTCLIGNAICNAERASGGDGGAARRPTGSSRTSSRRRRATSPRRS